MWLYRDDATTFFCITPQWGSGTSIKLAPKFGGSRFCPNFGAVLKFQSNGCSFDRVVLSQSHYRYTNTINSPLRT